MSNETTVKTRQSGIELLKIIAMFLIVTYHCECSFTDENSSFLQYFDISKPTTDITIFITQIIFYFGMLGNALFLISSVWFLVNSNNMKLNKIAHTVLNTYVISVIFLVIFLLGGVNLSIIETITSLFPMTMGRYWYVACYLLLYAIYPLLNTIIEKTTQKQHLAYNCAFFVLYFCMQSVKHEILFSSKLILFVGIYFIVAYVKKYNFKLISNCKFNVLCLLTGIVLLILLQLVMNFVDFRIDAIGSRMFHFVTNHNPIILLIAFSMFNLFRNIKLQSRVVNYFSSLTLLIYVIHENILFKHYLKVSLLLDFWKLIGKINIALFALIAGLALLIASTLAAILYNKFLQPWVHKLAECILHVLLRLYGKFEAFMLKLE